MKSYFEIQICLFFRIITKLLSSYPYQSITTHIQSKELYTQGNEIYLFSYKYVQHVNCNLISIHES